MPESSTITLPEHIKQLADARIATRGYSSLDEYVQALILADSAEPIPPELETHLLRALQTPAIELTDADWDEKRRRLTQRHNGARP